MDKVEKIDTPKETEQFKSKYRVSLGRDISGSISLLISNNLKYSSKICKANFSPTDNCQFYSIGSIALIMDQNNPIEILSIIYMFFKKRQILIDIRDDQLHLLEKVFDNDDYNLKSHYKNTTGTDMCMCLVSTKKMEEWIANPSNIDEYNHLVKIYRNWFKTGLDFRI